MADNFLGEIRPFTCPYPPKGWASCNGNLLPIQRNTALYSLLGTAFGGDGKTTFGLPNIQGQVLVGTGTLLGGDTYDIGDNGGEQSVTIDVTTMPAHSHLFNGAIGAGQASLVTNAVTVPVSGSSLLTNIIGKTNANPPINVGGLGYTHTTPVNTQLHPLAIQPTGGAQSHNNMAPYVVINYCIALEGVFPTRN